MVTIILNIPNEKFQAIAEGVKFFYPIPLGDNGQPLFVDQQWVKEHIIQQLKQLDLRRRVALARNQAEAGVQEDAGLLS